MNERTNANETAGPAFANVDYPVGMGQRGFVPAGVQPTGIAGRRVLWPVAIGAVSMVFGAQQTLAMAGYLLYMIGRLLSGGSPLSAFDGSDLWGLADAGIILLNGALCGALLLPAGLLVWRQSRLGPVLSIIFAILDILLTIGQPIARLMSYPEEIRTEWSFVIWPLWSATIGMIFPVFLLIWFARPKVKAETRLWP